MKAGDRMIWSRGDAIEVVEVELVEPDTIGWWCVQKLGQSTIHYAHVDELRDISPQEAPK